ncbi:MAG: CPBP family intramembrane glutamic endopeptidase [Chloroflexota bacterium]|nr:CPBP family intramembrane glutamic endopeptidase [Chloroflexota bacterium]
MATAAAEGPPERAPREAAPPGVPLAGAAILLLVHLALAPLAAFVLVAPLLSLMAEAGTAAPRHGATVGAISIVGGALTLAALGVFARSWPEPRRALGLVPSRLPLWRAAAAALALALAIDLALLSAGQPIVPPQLVSLVSSSLDTLLMAVAVVIVAPPVEELVYRGALYGALAPRWGTRTAWALTTGIFALVHAGTYGNDLLALGQVLLLGGLLTWLRAASGSLLPPLVGHAVANAYATALLLLAR